MAHSNRSKIKAGRGGLTKNQLRKSQKSSNYSTQINRLSEVIAWQNEREEKKKLLEESKSKNDSKEIKIKKFPKTKKVISRRKLSIRRLEYQLVTKVKKDKTGKPIPLESQDIKRIQNEISILKKRI